MTFTLWYFIFHHHINSYNQQSLFLWFVFKSSQTKQESTSNKKKWVIKIWNILMLSSMYCKYAWVRSVLKLPTQIIKNNKNFHSRLLINTFLRSWLYNGINFYVTIVSTCSQHNNQPLELFYSTYTMIRKLLPWFK